MKKIALFVMALMMSVAANAQFEQGKFYCGASFSGFDLGYSGLTKGHVNVQAKGGYLLWDNIMATAQLSYEKSKDTPAAFSCGIGGRYYIEQNGLFLGLSLGYKHIGAESITENVLDPVTQQTKEVTIDGNSYNDFMPSVQVGYAFFVSRTVTIEPELYYEQSFKNHKDYSNFGLRIGIGVYLFNDQKKN